MPKTLTKSSPLLSIRLEGDQPGYYAPGDTIIGCVARKTHVVGPRATVKVSMFARAKSKIVKSNGNSSSTYRGRFNLVNSRDTAQTLFAGPIHILQGGEQTWPFAVTVPTSINTTTTTTTTTIQGVSPEQSFLPLDPESLAATPLPPTFFEDYVWFSRNMVGFVEYVIEAELRVSGQGSSDVYTALLPVTVDRLSPDPPIVDFGLKKHAAHRIVSSHRLVPGMETAELSFSQRRQKFFGSAKVPQLHLRFEVAAPSAIQLDNPAPVPFKLGVAPVWERTSEIIRDVPQDVRLVGLELRIKATTRVRCEGTFGPHEEECDSDVDLGVWRSLARLKENVVIPSNAADEFPVDVGELLDLRIASCRQTLPSCTRPMAASFTTFNIKHWHLLKWKLRGAIGEEHFDISGQQRVELLPPSDVRGGPTATALEGGLRDSRMAPPLGERRTESWIRPPNETEAPPTFAQAQKEDEAGRVNNDGAEASAA